MPTLENIIYTALWKINSNKNRLSNPRVREQSDLLVKEVKALFDQYQGKTGSYDAEEVIQSAEKNFNAVYDRRTHEWCPFRCKATTSNDL